MMAEINNKMKLDLLHNMSNKSFTVVNYSSHDVNKASFSVQLNPADAVMKTSNKSKLIALILKLKKKETHKMILLQAASLPISYGFSLLVHGVTRFYNLYSMNMLHGLH